MQLPALITTDLHLVDNESCSYRWGLFPWINEQIEAKGIKSVRILGDLTDAKDKHSASLVNKVVNAIKSIQCDDILIMAGNHDWLLKGQEFFRFLNHLPNVRFVTEPWEDPDVKGPGPIMYLPYSKSPAKDWQDLDFSHYQYVFMHQTVGGAIASNVEAMEGEGVPEIPAGRVYSGDIHVPQTIKGVTYIGSPYHVHFGDNFEPRVLVLDRREREQWLRFPSPKRMTVKVGSMDQLINRNDIQAGDQIKLRVALPKEEQHRWFAFKRDAIAHLESLGALVFGVELELPKTDRRIVPDHRITTTGPEGVVYQFVSREGWPGDSYEAAMRIIES